jgi:hypothetical protein
VHEKKRNEYRRDADRHEPFVTHVAGRVKHQALLRQLVVKPLDERLQFRSLQFEAKLGNSAFAQLVVAEIGPIGGFHAVSVPGVHKWRKPLACGRAQRGVVCIPFSVGRVTRVPNSIVFLGKQGLV